MVGQHKLKRRHNTLRARQHPTTTGIRDPELDAHRRQFLGKPGSKKWNEYYAGLNETRMRLFGGVPSIRRNTISNLPGIQYGGSHAWLGLLFQEPAMVEVLKFVEEENNRAGTGASAPNVRTDDEMGLLKEEIDMFITEYEYPSEIVYLVDILDLVEPIKTLLSLAPDMTAEMQKKHNGIINTRIGSAHKQLDDFLQKYKFETIPTDDKKDAQIKSLVKSLSGKSPVPVTNINSAAIRLLEQVITRFDALNKTTNGSTLEILFKRLAFKEWIERLATFIKTGGNTQPKWSKIKEVVSKYTTNTEILNGKTTGLPLMYVIYILDKLKLPSSTWLRLNLQNSDKLLKDAFFEGLDIQDIIDKLKPQFDAIPKDKSDQPVAKPFDKIELGWKSDNQVKQGNSASKDNKGDDAEILGGDDTRNAESVSGTNIADDTKADEKKADEKNNYVNKFFAKPGGGITAEDIKIYLIPFFLKTYLRLIIRMEEDYSKSKNADDFEESEIYKTAARKKRQLVSFLIRVLREMNMYVNPVFLDDLYYYYYVLGLDQYMPNLDWLFRFYSELEEDDVSNKDVGAIVTMSSYPTYPRDNNNEIIDHDFSIQVENYGNPHKLWFDHWLNLVRLAPDDRQTEKSKKVERKFVFQKLKNSNADDSGAFAMYDAEVKKEDSPAAEETGEMTRTGTDESSAASATAMTMQGNEGDGETPVRMEGEGNEEGNGTPEEGVRNGDNILKQMNANDRNDSGEEFRGGSTNPPIESSPSVTTEYHYLPDSILHKNFEDCVQLGDALPDTPYTIHLAIFSLDWSCNFDEKKGPYPFLKFLVEKPAAGEMAGFAKMNYSCVGDTEENDRNFKCAIYDRLLDVLRLSIKGSTGPEPIADADAAKEKCERMGAILDSFYRGLVSEKVGDKTVVLAFFDYDAIDRVVGPAGDAVFERHDDTERPMYPIRDENVGSAFQWAIVDELLFNETIITTPVNPDISRVFAKHENLWNIVKRVPYCKGKSSSSADCFCQILIDFPFAVYNMEEVSKDKAGEDDKNQTSEGPVTESPAPLFRTVTVSPNYEAEGAMLREEGIPNSDKISLFSAVQLDNYGKEDEYDSRYCFSIKPIADAQVTSSSRGLPKRYAMFAWKPEYILDAHEPSSPNPADQDAEAKDAAILAKLETNTIYFRLKRTDESYVVWGIRNNNQFSAL